MKVFVVSSLSVRAATRSPEAQLSALMRAYADAVAAKRRRFVLGAAVFLATLLASAWMGEVALDKFASNLWRFFAYFGNTIPSLSLATLWADLAEWFWGLKRWLRPHPAPPESASVLEQVIATESQRRVQEALARLGAEHPGVALQVHARDTPRLVEQLVTQQIELVISVVPMEHPEIRVESLCRVPLVCILPPAHPLAARREIRCRDLADERFASFRHDSAVRRRIDQAFEDAKVRPRIVLEAPEADALRLELQSFVHAVQGARKAAGLEVSDRIALTVAGPADLVAACWSMRDYVSLSPGKLNDALALLAVLG